MLFPKHQVSGVQQAPQICRSHSAQRIDHRRCKHPKLYAEGHQDLQIPVFHRQCGDQQAAAQAANNVLAMEETLRQTNNDLVAINDNIKATNANIAALNNNIAKVLQALANEQGNATTASVRTISQLGFFLLLAIGALTEVKYIGLLLDGIAESRKSKVPEVQEAPVAEEA